MTPIVLGESLSTEVGLPVGGVRSIGLRPRTKIGELYFII